MILVESQVATAVWIYTCDSLECSLINVPAFVLLACAVVQPEDRYSDVSNIILFPSRLLWVFCASLYILRFFCLFYEPPWNFYEIALIYRHLGSLYETLFFCFISDFPS